MNIFGLWNWVLAQWINERDLSFFHVDYHAEEVVGLEYHAYCHLLYRYMDHRKHVIGIWKFDPWILSEGKIWEEIKIMPIEVG